MPQIGSRIAKLMVFALLLAVMLLAASVAFNALMPVSWPWKVTVAVVALLAVRRLTRWASGLLRYNP